MPEIVFPANTIIFSGCHPDHIEDAKKYARERGYTKDDIKIYKETSVTHYRGSDPAYKGKSWQHHAIIIKTKRPIAIDCGITEREKNDGNRRE